MNFQILHLTGRRHDHGPIDLLGMISYLEAFLFFLFSFFFKKFLFI